MMSSGEILSMDGSGTFVRIMQMTLRARANDIFLSTMATHRDAWGDKLTSDSEEKSQSGCRIFHRNDLIFALFLKLR
jgi:hypothetical protein